MKTLIMVLINNETKRKLKADWISDPNINLPQSNWRLNECQKIPVEKVPYLLSFLKFTTFYFCCSLHSSDTQQIKLDIPSNAFAQFALAVS